MTIEEIIDFCEMKAQLEPENEDIFNYIIKTLEIEPCEDCCNGNQIEKAKLCQKSYLAGMGHKQEPCEDCISREELLEQIYTWGGDTDTLIEYIKGMPSVIPKGVTITDFADKCRECGREKVLEDIKAEVEQYSLLTRERVIGIIDKHIGKE